MKNVEDVYPLSPLQANLLGHVLSEPASRVGIEQLSVDLELELDPELFRRTWQLLIDRHPILRTLFLHRGVEQPLQVVRRRVELPMVYEDWRGLPADERRARIEERRRTERDRGFDPGRAPLLRLVLLRLGDRHHHLIWSQHHLLLDGWCRNLLLEEAFELYSRLLAGGSETVSSRRPFRDYVAWLKEQEPGRAEEYWRRVLGGLSRPTPLPLEEIAGGGSERAGADELRRRQLPEPLSKALRQLAGEHDLTLASLFQAAWGLLLHRTSGDREVVFGTTVSGRPAELPGAETMLGMFVNNLPVRLEIPAGGRLVPWLGAVQEALAELRPFEHTPLEQVQEWSGLPWGHRLFETLVVFQSHGAPSASGDSLAALGVGPFEYSFETAYPLTLEVTPAARIELRLYAEPGRYPRGSVERLLGQLEELLSGFVTDPGARLDELPFLTAVELQQQLEWGEPPAVGGDLPAARLLAAAPASDPAALRRELEAADGGVVASPPGVWCRLLADGWEGAPGAVAAVVDEPPARGLIDALGERTAVVYAVGPPLPPTGIRLIARAGAGDYGVRPPPGVRVRILDPAGRRRPQGLAGELWAGQGTPAPTGRRARFLADGAIEELGELGAGDTEEVERVAAALRRHPAVLHAAVGPVPRRSGEERLVAWVVTRKPETVAELQRFLRRRLPRRSLPELIVPLPELPLDAAGRVDRTALPAPEAGPARPGFVPPKTPTELALVALWEELFELRPIGVDDSFFELGGHSLLALRLAAEVRRRLGRTLPLANLAGTATLGDLARLLDLGADDAERGPLVPIQPAGGRPPFFCVHPAGGTVLCYTPLAYELGREQPVYGLQARGIEDSHPPAERVPEMAADYLAAVRRRQPSGPYHLGGWSSGGLVALEMARQLVAAREEVAVLAIFDTYVGERFDRSEPDDAELLLSLVGDRLPIDAEELRRRGDLERQIAHLLERARGLDLLPPGFDAQRAERIFRVRRGIERAIRRYRAEPYPGRVTLFTARERTADVAEIAAEDPSLGWRPLAAELEIREVPGHHADMFDPPHATALAAALAAVLARARGVVTRRVDR